MANKTIEALIKCPFYSRESGLSLACEGVLRGTCLVTKFPNERAKQRHLKSNCYCVDGGECFLAKALFEKYEKE